MAIVSRMRKVILSSLVALSARPLRDGAARHRRPGRRPHRVSLRVWRTPSIGSWIRVDAELIGGIALAHPVTADLHATGIPKTSVTFRQTSLPIIDPGSLSSYIAVIQTRPHIRRVLHHAKELKCRPQELT